MKVANAVESSPTSPAPAPTRPRPDPEFARDPFPPAPLPSDFTPADHQRLVVNPFLGIVALVAWAWLTVRLAATSFPPAALLPLLIFGLIPLLIHYHCLDCGRTGIYPRWRGHSCPKVIERAHRDRPGWWRWPSARTQLYIWGYLLVPMALLLAVVGIGVFLARLG